MGAYREGQRVKAAKNIDQPTGAAWPGDTGKIIKKTGDGYHVRWDNRAVHTIPIKDYEIEGA